MRPGRFVLHGLTLSILLGLSGCGIPRWSDRVRAADYVLPRRIPIYVVVTEQVAKEDRHGAVLALATTLESELLDHGYDTQVVAATDDAPPVPRIELQVINVTPGNRALNNHFMRTASLGTAAVSLAGHGGVVVRCFVVTSADGPPVFSGQVSDGAGEDAIGPAEDVAGSIADALLE